MSDCCGNIIKGNAPAQDKQKSHFVKSDPICKNVYVFTKKSMQKLIANIAQI